MDNTLLQRVVIVQDFHQRSGNTVYWMSRDQRINCNWALLFAMHQAQTLKGSLAVVFCMVPEFLDATGRQYAFMIQGLQEVAEKLKEKNIPFYFLTGDPVAEIPAFCSRFGVAALVTDFDPLHIKRQWQDEVARKVSSSFYIVDAHNIVPAFKASDKAEYGAYTLRPKIRRLLPGFLNRFPELPYQKKLSGFSFDGFSHAEFISILNSQSSSGNLLPPGETQAEIVLGQFLENRLDNYETDRNNPVADATSGLSPYLHFGHISAQYIATRVTEADVSPASAAAFLEELIVRRELADNFCFYNSNYDRFSGFPAWAQKTLNEHRTDERAFIYSIMQFEEAKTHDDLWNAAQTEMVVKGKMHGYMRMYWAKKILEWTTKPEDALAIAIYLNNKYQLDGRDPNGYAGCAWAIGGVHDRAWNPHPVYGMIRYMNKNGCRRKFDVETYIRQNRAVD